MLLQSKHLLYDRARNNRIITEQIFKQLICIFDLTISDNISLHFTVFVTLVQRVHFTKPTDILFHSWCSTTTIISACGCASCACSQRHHLHRKLLPFELEVDVEESVVSSSTVSSLCPVFPVVREELLTFS